MQSFNISGLSRRLSRKFSAVSLFGRTTFKKESDFDAIDRLKQRRHKPRGLNELCIHTRFTRSELQLMYRGFKQECPTGLASEEKFKNIYAQFFPLGDSAKYARFVFRMFDEDRDGFVNFEDLVTGLSSLIRGDADKKIGWAFNLYDLNGDGVVSRDEMFDILSSIHDLLGKSSDNSVCESDIVQHVDQIFEKMDTDQDGVITLEEFTEACHKDENIYRSMTVFDTVL